MERERFPGPCERLADRISARRQAALVRERFTAQHLCQLVPEQVRIFEMVHVSATHLAL